MTFTDRMEHLMKQRGIRNIHVLSQIADIPYTTIDGFYKKGTNNIKLNTLRKLCDCLGCTLDYLANGVETDPKDEPIIMDLVNAAIDNDPEDIRLATEYLRRMKGYKNQVERMRGDHV